MNDPEEKWERLQDQFNTLLDENAALRARVVEWVSVEDRLPEKSGWYLNNTIDKDNGSTWRFMHYYTLATKEWDTDRLQPWLAVTHWAQDPGPPQAPDEV